MTLAQRLTKIIDGLYIKPLHTVVSRQTFRYAACGTLNSFIMEPILYFLVYHYVVRDRYTDLGFGFATISPHVASFIMITPVIFFVGFWFNRNITFRSSPLKGRTQLARYALVLIGAFTINYACLKLFVEAFHIYATPSKMLATAVCVVYSYLLQKYFTFRGAEKE